MPFKTEHTYFSERAIVARSAGIAATDPSSRFAHNDLAARYQLLADRLIVVDTLAMPVVMMAPPIHDHALASMGAAV